MVRQPKPLPPIDASALIKHLGIREPVDIRPADLNHGWDPELASLFFGSTTQGLVSSSDPHTVHIDLDAIEYLERIGAGPQHSDLATVVAHELVHVAQYERVPDPQAYAIANNTGPYNAMEAEAYDRAGELAQYVRVGA